MNFWKRLQCWFTRSIDSHMGPFTEIGYMAYRCEHCKEEFDTYL